MTTTMTQTPEPRTFHRAISPYKAPNDVRTSHERFPSFDHATPPNLPLNSNAVAESPQELTPGPVPNGEFRWPPRRMSQRLHNARPGGVYTHRHRRSVSDAFHRIRTRQGSVSENAQELAQALKAPVSYKLIVSRELWTFYIANARAGALHCVVHDLCINKHLLQINPERFPKTSHPHNRTICLGLHLVPHLDDRCLDLPIVEAINPCVKKWAAAAFLGCCVHCLSSLDLPASRTSAQLVRYIKDTRVSRPYNQRSIAAVHCPRISSCLPDPI